jgi:hypothetical protein
MKILISGSFFPSAKSTPTPLSGFSVEPFSIGDRIFVEGIEKYGNDGDGFNSEDYGYQFFTVTNYLNSNTLIPRKLEFNISGLTTNSGIAKTSNNLYATIVNYNNYPRFVIEQDFSQFTIGEILKVDSGLGFLEQDLKVTESSENYIKVSGSYQLEKDDVILGTQSGSIATVNSVKETTGQFNVDFSYLIL